MAIFAIIKQPGTNAEKLAPAIKETYPLHHYDLGGGAWLVASRGAAQDISDRLGITSGDNGSAIVIEAASYYGRANPAVWTWIKTNWSVGSG
jgi:hypothetical protein